MCVYEGDVFGSFLSEPWAIDDSVGLNCDQLSNSCYAWKCFMQ